MILTNTDVVELTTWRRMMHQFPEVSRDERETAVRVVQALKTLHPDQIITGLGGHGVAAVFNGAAIGPTVMFRAELDALPITEISSADHRSTIPGNAHLCGHEGHMTWLMGLARLIARKRTARGRVVLMFQPAEEDGSGAAAVVADPAYAALRPDWAFGMHNMPGVPFGTAWLAAGTICCASVGMKITLTGKTAHAAMPQTGVSPGAAMAALIPTLTALGAVGPIGSDYRLVTITHAVLGVRAFGIAPGEAEIWATLRTRDDGPMAALRADAEALVQAEATKAGLALRMTYHDDFAATVNGPAATAHLAVAMDALNIPHSPGDLPMRASEDFGRFGNGITKLAMVMLGAGVDHAALHNPDYDFPDGLIAPGVQLFHRLMTDILG